MLHFTTEAISTHITRIYAFATELMYLVEGSRHNILIDTGSGFGSLKTAVDAILSEHNNTAPLSVILTHGHVDHAGGAGEFTAANIPVYMNLEDQYIYNQHLDEKFRKDSLPLEDFGGHGIYREQEDYIPSAAFEALRDLKEGSRFDLGGVTIETYACPGHTLGSLVFLIEEEKGDNYLLTGDACNTCTFVFQEYSTSIEAYGENLAALAQKLRGRYEHILLSHGNGTGYVGLLEDVCQICETIKDGRADGIPFSFQQAEGKIALNIPPGSGRGNIVYHPDRIWKKDTVIA